MDLGLHGKVALITAASRGLGYAVARTMALEGATIAMCSRSAEAVQAAAAAIRAQSGAKVLAIAADVSQPADIERLCAATLESYGRIDALFINSGGPPPGAFIDLTPDAWQRAMNLIIDSAVRLAYGVIPTMQQQGGGSILANTSVSVRQPQDNLTLSNSLRLAVVGLIKTLSIELGPAGIRANAIAPGWTRTERIETLLDARSKRNQTAPETEAAHITAEIPLRRMGDPDEYARVATFLLSPAASYVTGVTLLVDGGLAKAVI